MQLSLRELGIRSAKWTSLSSIIVTVLNALQLVVLAFMLPPEDFGMMSIVLVILGLAQVFSDTGISAAIVFRQNSTVEQLSSIYWLNIASGVAVFVLVWLVAPFASILFDAGVAPLLRVASLVFLIAPLGNQFRHILQRDLRFEVLAKQEVFSAVAGVIITIGLAALGYGVLSLVLGLLAVNIVQAGILLEVGLRDYRPLLHFRVSDLKGFLSFGAFQMGEKSSAFVGERIDQILIGSTLGSTALGIYWFALNLTSQPISRINPIVNRIAFPLFAKIQEDRPRLRRGYMTIVSLLTLVNAPILLGMAVVAPLFIPTVFGEKWEDSIVLIQILSLVALSRTIGNPIGSLLLSVGWANRAFYWTLIFLLLSIPGVYLGGWYGDAIGIALSLLFLQVLFQFITYYLLLRPILGLHGVAYLKTLLSSVLPGGVMALVVYCLPLLFTMQNSWQMLTLQIITGIILYAALVLLFKPESLGALRRNDPEFGPSV